MLQNLSQEELQEILQELAKRDITIKPVKMQKIVKRLKGKISIGGDAVKEVEKLYGQLYFHTDPSTDLTRTFLLPL